MKLWEYLFEVLEPSLQEQMALQNLASAPGRVENWKAAIVYTATRHKYLKVVLKEPYDAIRLDGRTAIDTGTVKQFVVLTARLNQHREILLDVAGMSKAGQYTGNYIVSATATYNHKATFSADDLPRGTPNWLIGKKTKTTSRAAAKATAAKEKAFDDGRPRGDGRPRVYTGDDRRLDSSADMLWRHPELKNREHFWRMLSNAALSHTNRLWGHLRFSNGITMSIQAGDMNYSKPRKVGLRADQYTEYEVKMYRVSSTGQEIKTFNVADGIMIHRSELSMPHRNRFDKDNIMGWGTVDEVNDIYLYWYKRYGSPKVIRA